ncbi:hypothetical protein ACS0TY_007876 [Phlomoides rotata]
MHERVSDYRPPTSCQFSDEILHDELPFNFKTLNYEYEGTSDPYEDLVRVSDYRPPTGCQFSDEILHDELSSNSKPLNYEYDGTSVPYEQLVRFENPTLLHRYGEEVKCRVFLTTLSKATQQWFIQLSIVPLVHINALTNGLRDGDLFSSLAKKHVQTFDKLLKRAEKYMTLEEVKRAKKAQIKSSTVEKKKEPALKWSGPDQPKGGPQRPKSDKFYRFYNNYGHDTNSCYHLKDEIERVIQAGHLKEFVYQDRQGPRGHKRKEHEKKPDDKGKAPQDDNEWSH